MDEFFNCGFSVMNIINGKKGNLMLKKGNFIEDLWKHCYQWRSQRRVSGHANEHRRRETGLEGPGACPPGKFLKYILPETPFAAI